MKVIGFPDAMRATGQERERHRGGSGEAVAGVGVEHARDGPLSIPMNAQRESKAAVAWDHRRVRDEPLPLPLDRRSTGYFVWQ
jgi:hypothetical protein